MLTPRRFASPAFIVGALLTVVILLELIIYRGDYLHGTHPDTEAIKSAVDTEVNYQDKIDKIDLPEYKQELYEELKTIKENEVLEQIKTEVTLRVRPELIQKLRLEITENFAEKFKASLKNKIDTEYTEKLFEEANVSYELYNHLKSEYFKKHGDSINRAAIMQVFKELNLPEVQLPKDFDLKLNKKIEEKYSKSNWYKFLIDDLLLKHAPTVKGITTEEKGEKMSGVYYKDVQSPAVSKTKLGKNRLVLPESKFKDLQLKHDEIVKAIKRLDDPPREFVDGDGIVISGGGVYFGSALVAIGQLREMGSKLPIELVINSEDEYDKQICEELLPTQFNAKCIVMEREIGKDLLARANLSKFQLKIFGLLFSSFNNIITIDADNMPIKNVDDLLTSEPYLSTKFIMWPDIWHKGVSPVYYDIARFKAGEPIRRDGIANDWSWMEYIQKNHDDEVALHDREGMPPSISMETGQMVFSKRAHFKSFLLALYYNMNGPEFYYWLLYQGVPGEGDRETFVPALEIFKEPYHIVKHESWLAGFKSFKDQSFQETTIVQYDPTQNLKFFEDWEDWLKNVKKLDVRLWPYQSNSYTTNLLKEFKTYHSKIIKPEKMDEKTGVKVEAVVEKYKMPDVFFFHMHNPKVNPIQNAKEGEYGIYSKRNLGLPGTYEDFGSTDWELQIHSISRWIACKGITSEDFWKNVAKTDQKEVCRKVTEYVNFLKKDSQDLSAEKLKYLN